MRKRFKGQIVHPIQFHKWSEMAKLSQLHAQSGRHAIS